MDWRRGESGPGEYCYNFSKLAESYGFVLRFSTFFKGHHSIFPIYGNRPNINPGMSVRFGVITIGHRFIVFKFLQQVVKRRGP